MLRFITLCMLCFSFAHAEEITVLQTSGQNFYRHNTLDASFWADIESGDVYALTDVGITNHACLDCPPAWESVYGAQTKIENMKLSSDLRLEFASVNGIVDCGYLKKKRYAFQKDKLIISPNCSLKATWVKSDVKVVFSVR